MSFTVHDALGRALHRRAPATRIVSLVPSETESVARLGGVERLVGRTSYCEEPRGEIERVPTCGGTKDVDVEKVLALRPDLVLANKEENARPAIEQLIAAGLDVHVSFPCTCDEGLAYLETLARLLGLDPETEPHVASVRAALGAVASERTLGVFVPVWMDPLMTFDGRVFASDLLARVGLVNVFADRARRYPLAADLGDAPALSAERVGDRDTRYPRVRLDEVDARAPDCVLLPNEPHPFTESDAAVFRARPIPAAARDAVVFCDGKDLFWYGARMADALPRLAALGASLRAKHAG